MMTIMDTIRVLAADLETARAEVQRLTAALAARDVAAKTITEEADALDHHEDPP